MADLTTEQLAAEHSLAYLDHLTPESWAAIDAALERGLQAGGLVDRLSFVALQDLVKRFKQGATRPAVPAGARAGDGNALSDQDIKDVHDFGTCLPDMVGLKDQWPEILRFARAVIAADRAMLAAAPAVSAPAWQPIETGPKDGKDLLVFTASGMVRLAFWDRARGGVWSCWPGREKLEPSHWMPLPADPVFPAPVTGDAA